MILPVLYCLLNTVNHILNISVYNLIIIKFEFFEKFENVVLNSTDYAKITSYGEEILISGTNINKLIIYLLGQFMDQLVIDRVFISD